MTPAATFVIFGGTGFIGRALNTRLRARFGPSTQIILADLRDPNFDLAGSKFVQIDVRKPIDQLLDLKPDWIFNFAAIHREPGHHPAEYYETNTLGAKHVCAYAETVKCENILFTSSIAVYGHSPTGVTENSATVPATPYGGSKLLAELMHEKWQCKNSTRRLITMRPGVIYGPGDPGNILRMLKAIRRGIFVIPGNPDVKKSYGYIDELLDAFEFLMARPESVTKANFCHPNPETISELAIVMARYLGKREWFPVVPLAPVILLSHLVQWATLGKSPIHPVRVRKVQFPTHVEPQTLKDLSFTFKFPMKQSLDHWKSISPHDFD